MDGGVQLPAEYESHLKLGTCSWKYDSWKGLVYREDATYRPDDYLPDYARHYPTVEIDQWFWSLFPSGVKMPDPGTVRTYAENVPEDFVFSVKAPNAITLTHFYARQTPRYRDHASKPNPHFLSLEYLHRFLEALSPMGSKLGPILFQFEYLNRMKMPSRQAFCEVLHEFFAETPKGYRYAIETRNPNYLHPDLFDFLRQHDLGYVFIDGYHMPPIGEVFSSHDTFTADFSIIRLHGGDREGMERRTGKAWNRIVDPRPAGLSAAARIVRENARRRIESFVYANNHYEGSAPLTIDRFLDVLRRNPIPPERPADTV